MDFNFSEFDSNICLVTDNGHVSNTDSILTSVTTDAQSIALLPKHKEENDNSSKMLSETKKKLEKGPPEVSKSADTSKKVTSILKFDYPSLSNCIIAKKSESFIKKLPLKSFECYECNKAFPSFAEVVTHLKLIHNACASRDCSKISNFKMHSPVCVNRGLGCAICNKKFQEKQLLLMHFNEHIDAAFYACEVCREGFQQRKDLQKHFFQTHNKFLSLPVTSAQLKVVYQKCEHCSKYFKLFAEFEEHVSSCSTYTYACNICKVAFKSLSVLEEHKFIEHKTEQAVRGNLALRQGKRYFCGICYLGFHKGGILKEHIATHKVEMSYICDVCHICFSCDNDLQEHYLQHIEEHYVLHDVIQQHSCGSCMKTFKTQTELKDHLMLKNCMNNSNNNKLDSKDQSSSAEHLTSDKENAGNNSLTSQNTLESNAPFDFSNVPVYVLKVGEDLLNCDDSQCVVVLDLTSLFVLQRGICASESRMPDVKDSEVYGDTEVVDASLLENHMLQILSTIDSTDSEKMSDFQKCNEQNNDSNVETIILNINESNDASVKSVGPESNAMYYQSASVSEDPVSMNGKYEFLVYDNSSSVAVGKKDGEGSPNKVIVQENKSYVNENVENSDSVNKESLIGSENAVGVSGLYICNICKQVFSSKTSLCLHVKGSHTGFDCYRCGDSFNSEDELKNHEKVLHLSAFQCDLCEVSYPKEHLLKKHKRTAHNGSSYFCNICNKTYMLKNEYDVHMMLHKGKMPPTKCEECGKIYASVSSYMRHKATHQSKTASEKYICTICDRSFTVHSTLKLHLASHIRKSPYNSECPKCKMYFPPKLLAKHVESHVDIVSS